MDELEQKLSRTKAPAKRLALLLQLIETLLDSKPGRSLEFSNEAQALADQLGDSDAACQVLYYQGDAQRRLGNYLVALTHLQQAADLSEWLRNRHLQAQALLAEGLIYDNLGDYPLALERFITALELFEAAGDPREQARALLMLGGLDHKTGNFERAKEHFERGYKLQMDSGDLLGTAKTLNQLGLTHERQGRLQSAHLTFKTSSTVAHGLGNTMVEAEALANLAAIYEQLGERTKARLDYERSLELLKDQDDKLLKAELLRRYGEMLLKQGELAEAQTHLNASLILAEALESRPQRYQTHLALAQLHKAQDDFEAALTHFERYGTLKEEVMSETTQGRLKRMQIGFELEQTQREKELLNQKNRELAEAYEQLKLLNSRLTEQNNQDPLTGLYNRRFLDSYLRHEFQRSTRYQHALSVAMCDIDLFKGINDRLGHKVGDDVLKVIADLLKTHTRDADVVARFGGEEFVIVFLETSLKEAVKASEAIRQRIADYPWFELHPELSVTISIGLSADLSSTDHRELLDKADNWLYEAKRRGRNQVCCEL